MIDYLLGVPGKLKAVYDHLTTHLASARAAKIDNLDAAISTRAAASTALSTATWTPTRADNLDSTNGYIGKSRSQTFTSSGTWIRPAGVTAVRVYVQGGGGGGGGAGTGGGGSAAAIGGKGATGELIVADVPVSGNVVVTVGAAGSGGAQGVAGVAGGSSTFAADLSITALGGASGGAGSGTSTPGANALFTSIESMIKPPAVSAGANWSYIVRRPSNAGMASLFSDGPAVSTHATANSGCGGSYGPSNGVNVPGLPGSNGGSGRVIVFWIE